MWTGASSWLTVRPLAGAGIEISMHALISTVTPVRPLAGAGIEIRCHRMDFRGKQVRPLAGAGIEISIGLEAQKVNKFAPSRGRELK